MLAREKFDEVKRKFGYCASWAIWAEKGNRAKDGVGDTSVLDPDLNPSLLSQIHSNFVVVGLNFSRNLETGIFANFHDSSPKATDYKIRHAFQGTPLWGSYMTDILKDFVEVDSRKAASYFRSNPDQLACHKELFLKEIELLGGSPSAIVAFGRDARIILENVPELPCQVIGVTHYAHFISADNYRKHVHSTLEKAL